MRAPWESEEAAFGFLLRTVAVVGAIVAVVLLLRLLLA